MRILITVFSALVILSAGIRPAQAQLEIDITQGVVEPLPVAITEFVGTTPNDKRVGQELAGVIANNLQRSGLFRPISSDAFIQTAESLQVGPRYADWRIIDAQALIGGAIETLPDGRLRVEFRLWDVFAEREIAGLAYTTVPENWRRVGHIVSDAIYKRITGEDGYFDTRIVYISEEGEATHRIKRLAIMDQDGFNHRYLTDRSTLVLTPRFSPTAQEITYLAYVNNQPRVYLLNIDTGRIEVLGSFPGMTFAPRFSPDGNRVIMSQALNGNTDIYSMDLRTRQVARLTESPAIDTSPSYSPDGRRIVFESDRGGAQQLYVMNADSRSAQRISFGEGRYASPVWSPRGDLIAFTKIHKGRFYIGVMRPDGGGERLLTEAFHVEGLTWAPNGRVLMYFKEETRNGQRRARLYTIDLTGQNEQMVRTPVDGSDPAWSSLIP